VKLVSDTARQQSSSNLPCNGLILTVQLPRRMRLNGSGHRPGIGCNSEPSQVATPKVRNGDEFAPPRVSDKTLVRASVLK
jgi:hypothetical protein